MNKDIVFDTNEDVLFQVAMIIYDRHNDSIASINDHLGEIFSYRDLEDAERAELEDEKDLLTIAVQQLQKENKRLKQELERKEL